MHKSDGRAAGLDRRVLLLGLAGLGPLGGCAPFLREPQVLVNLADLAQAAPVPPEPQAAPTEDAAQLRTDADIASRVTIPVYLNGQGPFEFVVDTGANHSVVAIEVAAPLNLPSAGRAEVHGIAGAEPADTAIVNRLDVGAVVSRRVKVPLLTRARLGAAGLLGVDVLKNRRVLIDFEHNELQISASGSGPPKVTSGRGSRIAEAEEADPTAVTVPARYRFGQLIIIDADVGGQPVTAFLDSGSQNTVGNLALREKVLSEPALAAQALVVQLISATGQQAAGELAPLPPLRLGGLTVGGMSAVFSDLHVFDIWDLKAEPAILIGVDVMRHFRSIELDFGRRVVVFRTPPRRTPLPASLLRP